MAQRRAGSAPAGAATVREGPIGRRVGSGRVGGSRLVRAVAVPALAVGAFAAVPSTAGAGSATVLPVPSFAVTSTRCAGPTYLPTVVNAVNLALSGLGPPGSPLLSIPYLSSCSPPPAVLSPLLSASVTSEASAGGSASVSAQALGDAVVEESATVDTVLAGTVVLPSATPSVSFTVPYTTAGLTASGNAGLALVSFDGWASCADGSGSIWSFPPGQYDLGAPMGPASGTWTVDVSCPDGSDLAAGPATVDLELMASAYSSGQQADASATFAVHDATATVSS